MFSRELHTSYRSHGCSSAPGGQACRVSKQCRQPVTHRSPLPLPGPLSLSQTPLPRHLFGLFAVSHLPPAFSEFDLKVLSSMFHILYMHLHVFRCVCLLEFALGFLYTLHAAGFLFALWKSHEFWVRGWLLLSHLIVITVKTGRRPRGSRHHSWTAGPTKHSWILITTWMTFGMTGQIQRSIKLFCTCVREGFQWLVSGHFHCTEEKSYF